MSGRLTIDAEVAPAAASAAKALDPPRRRLRRRRLPGTSPSIWFALPALLVYVAVIVYPSLAGAAYAFTDWNGLRDTSSFVGLDNFRDIFTDDESFGALRNTLLITVFIVVVQNIIGLALALGVNSALRSGQLLRVIFFAPVVVSPVVVAFLWKYLFNPSPDAGINALLGAIGLDSLQQDWIGNSDIALWAVGFTVIWQFAGYAMVIFLAGLQNVPKELLEAAELDGAGPIRRFWSVTLPLLGPAITINVLLSTIGGLKIFDQVIAITNGGPGYATETLAMLIYKEAFVLGHFGYSTALALVLSLIVAAVALVQLHYLRRREVAA